MSVDTAVLAERPAKTHAAKVAAKPLKVGLLLDSYSVPSWTHKMIECIQSSDYASIELVIVNHNEPEEQVNNTLFEKVTRNRGRIGYLAVRKVLELIYSKVIARNMYLPDAEQTLDCRDLLKKAQEIPVTTKRTKWSDYFHADDIQKIRDAKPDILVRCGFGILRGDILNAAKHGIWSYHHGDNSVNRGGPAGFWESMESWPETGAILQILSEDLDNGKVLYRSFSRTETMSVEDNKNNYYWKSVLFITRKMQQLHKEGPAAFYSRVEHENQHPVIYSNRLYTQPTNAELAKLTFNKVVNKIRLQYKNRFKLDQWILLFHLKDEFSSSLWRYEKIIPPKDRFWADPHVVERNDKYYIFIEEYLYKDGKGHIAVITMDKDGAYSEPTTILKTDYHLSYPHIFEYQGKTYMIPESGENKTVELYECIEFPHKWEYKYNLMENVTALDSTLLEHNGKWWLFANVVEHDGVPTDDELFIYYADSPLSKNWTPHKMNPVISDCKLARPAGKLFRQGNHLYRPSQNCSVCYGYGFNFNSIDVLNKNEYKETLVTRVLPDWEKNILATHTFSRAGRLHVIDAVYQRNATKNSARIKSS